MMLIYQSSAVDHGMDIIGISRTSIIRAFGHAQNVESSQLFFGEHITKAGNFQGIMIRYTIMSQVN